MAPSDNKPLLAALDANWQAEMEGFSTYSALAKNESDPHRRNALRGLATAEKHHADLWAERIKVLGGTEPHYNGDPAGQAASLANRVGGADLALRRLEIDEGRDIPFFFMTGIPAVIVAAIVSAIVSLLAHFAVGAAKSLITIRSWWASGFEMTWIGALEGVVTYIIGIGLGKIGGG
jgi:VIT family